MRKDSLHLFFVHCHAKCMALFGGGVFACFSNVTIAFDMRQAAEQVKALPFKNEQTVDQV